MNSVKAFFIRKWQWAKQNPLFWWNLLLIIITSSVVFIWSPPVTETGPSDFRIRTWGMVLQLLGIYTVWHDLTSTARAFGKGDIMSRTLTWIKAGLFKPKHILGAVSIALQGATGRARMKQRHPLHPHAPLADRVTAIEANFQYLDQDLDGAFNEIDTRSAELETKIKHESAERTEAMRDIKEQLDKAVTGNFSVLAFGAVWLAIGVIVATWAPELAKIAAGQWQTVWRAM